MTAAAGAQQGDSAVRIDQLHPASAGSPFIRAEGPHEKFNKGIAFGMRVVGDYQLDPVRSAVVIDGADGEVVADMSPVQHAALIHVGGAISPLYWMNFEFDVPFAVFEDGTEDTRVNAQTVPAGSGGVGDVRVGAHFRFISTKKLDLSVGARVWFPLGQRSSYLGAGEADLLRFEIAPAVAGELDFLLYGCTLGLAPLWFAGGDGQRMAASCAAHFKVSKLITLGIEPHLAAFTYASREAPRDSLATPGLGNADIALQFEPLAVVGFRIGDFALTFAGGVGLGGAPGVPTARGVLSLSYAARGEAVVEDTGARDGDLDGVPDGYDACPNEAGPKDRRGCPDKLDSDGDGIIEDDACPDERGARYDDPKANGCPDRDNDHLADPVDPCPDEPGADTGGCPKLARLKRGQFVVKPPISFQGATAKLDDSSQQALIEIMRTMRANPKLKQVSIGVGTKGAGTALTDRRAKALLELFSEQTFDTNRFEVVLDDKLRAGRVSVRVIR